MFVAWRDLLFAKGRFALMGTVIILITMLVGLLSGLTAGLGKESTSAITGLSADRLAFSEPAAGKSVSFTDSTVTESMWQQWSSVDGVDRADPLGITTTKAEAGEHSAAISAFGVQQGSALAPESDRIVTGTAVLSTSAADELDVSTGDDFRLGGQRLTVAAIDGDRAIVTSIVDAVHFISLDDRVLIGDLIGRYTHHLVRQDDWKIAAVTLAVVGYPAGKPAFEAAFAAARTQFAERTPR